MGGNPAAFDCLDCYMRKNVINNLCCLVQTTILRVLIPGILFQLSIFVPVNFRLWYRPQVIGDFQVID